MSDIRKPAKNPCGSCPYRQDVPSGVWHPDEYAKLPPFDGGMAEQPLGLFMCHQQDGRVCAGWAGCHDMEETLGVRHAVAVGNISVDLYVALVDYTTDVPLFPSGTAAAAHGMRDIENPDDKARRTMDKVKRKQERR